MGLCPKRLILSLAVMLIPLGMAPVVASAAPVRLGYLEFPPFTYSDSSGMPRGTLIEMVQAVAADAGVDLVARAVPPPLLFQAIADGSVQLFMGLTTTPEFVGTTLVGESVIARIELDAYALDAVPEVRRPEDLAGRTVILHQGYTYGGWRSVLEDPASRVTLIEADSAARGLALLRDRKASLLLEYTLPIKLAVAGRMPADVKAAAISVVDAHFVVSKRAVQAAALLAKLERSFQRLRAAGSLP